MPVFLTLIRSTMPTAESMLSETQSWMDQMLPKLLAFGWDILTLILIFFVGSRVIRLFLRFFSRAFGRTSLESTIQSLLLQVIRVGLYMVLVGIMFDAVGYTTSSIVAIIGSAGLSIGLGFQGALSNFAGGILLMVTRPFQIGDYISEDTHHNEGTVLRITLGYTTLRTPDEKTVVIPNGTLANCSLTNFSTQGRRRVSVSVMISYEDDLKKAKEIMRGVLEALPHRLAEEPVKVFVDELADSGVVLGGWVWVTGSEYFASRWQATEEIKLEFDKNKIHIPFPQMDVYVRNGE